MILNNVILAVEDALSEAISTKILVSPSLKRTLDRLNLLRE